MADFDWSKFAVDGAARPDSFSGMDPRFSTALANMFTAAPPDIQASLRVSSGFRSPERQAQLWQDALAKYGSPEAARKWVAPPGSSQHNHGNAADLKYLSPTALDWAHKNAGQFGLAFPLSNENWHVELAGARGQGQPAPATAVASAGVPPAMPEQPGAVAPAAPVDPGANPFAAPTTPGAQLAMLYGQAVAQQRKRQEDEMAAEAQRRAALFG